MISRCPSVTFALRADEPDKPATGIFVGGNHTCHELRRIAAAQMSGQTTEYLDSYLRSRHPDLAAPVSRIFRRHTEKFPYEGHFHIMQARDPEEEVSFICSQICELLSQDETLHCRDIAIAIKDAQTYLPRLRRAMVRYGLPYDSTEQRPLLHTELVRHILTVLELISGTNWNTELLLRYVKSKFSGYPAETGAMLDHFCFTWSIEHEDWEVPFFVKGEDNSRTKDFDGMQLEKFRGKLIGEMTSLRERCSGQSVRTVCTVLYQHLSEKKEAYRKTLEELSETRQKDFVMVWNLVCDCLDTLVTGHSDTVLPVKRIYEQMILLLQASSFSVPPQTVDSIHIADAQTSRLNAPRVLFVPGVLEGMLPGDITLSGMFSQQELQLLDHERISISRLLPELHSDELMIAVRLLSSPSEYLWLTYPASDMNGGNCMPSPIIDEIGSMFREPVRSTTGTLPVSFFVRSGDSAYDIYVRRMHEDTPEIAALREVLSGYEEYAARLAILSKAPEEPHVSPETMQLLCGSTLQLSPSGIEHYYQCPFLYFCNHVLALYGLEQILRDVPPDAFCDLGEEDLRKLISGYSERYSEANFSDAMRRSSRFRLNYDSTGKTLLSILKFMQETFRKEEFRPVGFEVNVSADPQEGEYPALSVSDEQQQILCAGTVDRVDLYENEGIRLLRVVDYKTGNKMLDPEKLAYGLDMQMLLYLFALQQGEAFGNATPAGVLYLPAGQLNARYYEERQEKPTDREESLRRYYCGKGLLTKEAACHMEPQIREKAIPVLQHKHDKEQLFSVTSNQMQHLAQHVERTVLNMGKRLGNGEIAPHPFKLLGSDPCSYCAYSAICGKTEDGREKQLTKEEKAEKLFEVFGMPAQEQEEETSDA